MKQLSPDLGIEIFYEWANPTYWDLALTEAFEGRAGKFSIHAPYQGDIVEMSLTDKEDEMFAYLQEPFKLYHKFGNIAFKRLVHKEEVILSVVKYGEFAIYYPVGICYYKALCRLSEYLFKLH